jgi:hypothetical protein
MTSVSKSTPPYTGLIEVYRPVWWKWTNWWWMSYILSIPLVHWILVLVQKRLCTMVEGWTGCWFWYKRDNNVKKRKLFLHCHNLKNSSGCWNQMVQLDVHKIMSDTNSSVWIRTTCFGIPENVFFQLSLSHTQFWVFCLFFFTVLVLSVIYLGPLVHVHCPPTPSYKLVKYTVSLDLIHYVRVTLHSLVVQDVIHLNSWYNRFSKTEYTSIFRTYTPVP